MKYPYQSHQIVEILDKAKCLPEGDTVEIESTKGSAKGRQFDTKPELIDGPFVDMRYLGKAPVVDDTKTSKLWKIALGWQWEPDLYS